MKRAAIILNCSILASCVGSAPYKTTPIATWQGKNSIDAAVSCVTKALDYNFGSPKPPLPGITHRAKVVEEGRVFEIAPETAFGIEPLYFVRERSEGSQKTINDPHRQGRDRSEPQFNLSKLPWLEIDWRAWRFRDQWNQSVD
jgi:hypothetical protein